MILTFAERKMVAKLKRRKESSAEGRWSFLFFAALNVFVGILGILFVREHLSDPDSKHFTHDIYYSVLMAPISCCLILIGAWLIIDKLINWHGRPEVDLMLRLIEESQDNTKPKRRKMNSLSFF
jgi:hypothetical protein